MIQMKIWFEQGVIVRTTSEKNKDSDLIKRMVFWEDSKNAGEIEAEEL